MFTSTDELIQEYPGMAYCHIAVAYHRNERLSCAVNHVVYLKIVYIMLKLTMAFSDLYEHSDISIQSLFDFYF